MILTVCYRKYFQHIQLVPLNRTCPVEKAVHRIANTDACNRCRLECDERIVAKLPFSCFALLCRYTPQNVPTYISLMNY